MGDGKKLLVIGGRGALGSVVLQYFKSNGYWTASIDHGVNDKADLSISIDQLSLPLMEEQAAYVEKQLEPFKDLKFYGIICVAGGWAGGNASDGKFLQNADLMWRQCVQSSLLAAFLGAKFLQEKGFLYLTGAKAALDPTPEMLGYGIAKAAVHQLVKSLGSKGSGLPEGARVIGLLPTTLDTPNNRKFMPAADFGTWTKLQDIVELMHGWMENSESAPESGNLVSIVTENGKTTNAICT